MKQIKLESTRTVNPFPRYRGKEDHFQMAAAEYVRLQYPQFLFCHIANERQTSPMRGRKLKEMGVRPGMPDILIFDIKFACELKVYPNRPTKKQLAVLDHLERLGWSVFWTWSMDEFRQLLNECVNRRAK
jgi:hypothetical protein